MKKNKDNIILAVKRIDSPNKREILLVLPIIILINKIRLILWILARNRIFHNRKDLLNIKKVVNLVQVDMKIKIKLFFNLDDLLIR